jgi:hypothetical protein
MNHVDLAWALAGAAEQCLTARQRLDCYVALGAGDLATAIEISTRALVLHGAEISAGTGAALRNWRDAYPDAGPMVAELLERTADMGEDRPPVPGMRYLTVRDVYRTARPHTPESS